MPKLAQLATQPVTSPPVSRGPRGNCDIYGPGDMDDWREVERRRLSTSWLEAQKAVDRQLGIAVPMHTDKFRYHWGRKCRHWTDEQRAVELEA